MSNSRAPITESPYFNNIFAWESSLIDLLKSDVVEQVMREYGYDHELKLATNKHKQRWKMLGEKVIALSKNFEAQKIIDEAKLLQWQLYILRCQEAGYVRREVSPDCFGGVKDMVQRCRVQLIDGRDISAEMRFQILDFFQVINATTQNVVISNNQLVYHLDELGSECVKAIGGDYFWSLVSKGDQADYIRNFDYTIPNTLPVVDCRYIFNPTVLGAVSQLEDKARCAAWLHALASIFDDAISNRGGSVLSEQQNFIVGTATLIAKLPKEQIASRCWMRVLSGFLRYLRQWRLPGCVSPVVDAMSHIIQHSTQFTDSEVKEYNIVNFFSSLPAAANLGFKGNKQLADALMTVDFDDLKEEIKQFGHFNKVTPGLRTYVPACCSQLAGSSMMLSILFLLNDQSVEFLGRFPDDQTSPNSYPGPILTAMLCRLWVSRFPVENAFGQLMRQMHYQQYLERWTIELAKASEHAKAIRFGMINFLGLFSSDAGYFSEFGSSTLHNLKNIPYADTVCNKMRDYAHGNNLCLHPAIESFFLYRDICKGDHASVMCWLMDSDGAQERYMKGGYDQFEPVEVVYIAYKAAVMSGARASAVRHEWFYQLLGHSGLEFDRPFMFSSLSAIKEAIDEATYEVRTSLAALLGKYSTHPMFTAGGIVGDSQTGKNMKRLSEYLATTSWQDCDDDQLSNCSRKSFDFGNDETFQVKHTASFLDSMRNFFKWGRKEDQQSQESPHWEF